MEKAKQMAVIEAVLFAMGEAVPVKKLSELIEADDKDTIAILEEMKDQMDGSDRGVTLTQVGDSYQMCSKQELYEYLIEKCEQITGQKPQTGQFGALMKVHLTNYGPFTIIMDSEELGY